VKLIKYKHHTLVTIYSVNDFNDLINQLNSGFLKNTSVIINFLQCNIVDDMIVDKLLPFHFIWQKRNNSFILVSNISRKINKEIVSLPTLEEALDYFHMEQLTKNI